MIFQQEKSYLVSSLASPLEFVFKNMQATDLQQWIQGADVVPPSLHKKTTIVEVTYLEVLHSRWFLCALTEHWLLHAMASAIFQDIIKWAEV